MKIAIFSDTFLPQVNGVVTTTLNLVKGLARRGHKIYLIIPKFRKAPNFRFRNVCVRRISSVPAFIYPGFKFTSVFSVGLLRFLKKENIDLIHFQAPMTLGFQAIMFSKFLKVPLVGTFHTLFQDPQYLKHVIICSTLLQRISWWYARKYYSKCDLITCPTEEIKKELRKHGFNKKMIAISNGIDKKSFDGSKAKEVRKRYNEKGGILLFVGRVSYDKNIPFLLDSFKRVLKDLPETKLLIVGGGPQLESLKEKAEKEKLSQNVVFVGEIDHSKFVRSSILNACDVFVTPSLTETQGISILEAQVNGIVCVGMNSLGVKNLIKDGRNGFLINKGDEKGFAEKVVLLLKNKKKKEIMQKNTLKDVEQHNIEGVLDVWEKEYALLLNKNKKTF